MVPTTGDIYWVDFGSAAGTEQAGRRPALVLSGQDYHRVSTRAIVCPITSNTRPWPFKTALPEGMRTRGAILIDQLRTIDRDERLYRFIERAPREVLEDVRARIASLIGIEDADHTSP